MSRFRIVEAPSLPAYDLGPGHPFARERQMPLFDLLRRHRLYSESETLHPTPATRAELQMAHEPGYIEAIEALSAPSPDPSILARAPRFGMGTTDNPITSRQHEGAAAVVGGTLACVRAVLSRGCERAFNPAGGLHHAMPAAASGFCIYNDLVAGIREARRLGAERVAYVDFDVHHGDGVEHAFRDDPHVLTVSFHEDPAVRWPGTGRVTDCGVGPGRDTVVDIPLAPGTDDASWQDTVAAVLHESVAPFRPDLLVTQHGCDTHYLDPLADLELTTRSVDWAARTCVDLASAHCGGRWIATGGGGYRPYDVIPRAWAIVWARLSERELTDPIDADWRREWQGFTPDRLPEHWLDPPISSTRSAVAATANRRTLERWRSTRVRR